uniref:Uncharacterized protein n=3 Tax=Rhodnius TaxID=13248 RepID=T1HA02_RHOPR
MDIETLIRAVQQHPALWDTHHPDYKSKVIKHEAWIQVGKTLFEEFNWLSAEQQKLRIQDVTTKWRTVRDNYVRNLKKQAEGERSGWSAKRIKGYVHGELLSFLRLTEKSTAQCLSPNESDSLVESQDLGESSTETATDGDCAGANQRSLTSATPPPIACRAKELSLVERSLVDYVQAHMSRTTAEEDEDLAFFYSILPTVRTLTPNEKLSFRIQTMQYLQNVKQQSDR